MIGYDVGMLS